MSRTAATREVHIQLLVTTLPALELQGKGEVGKQNIILLLAGKPKTQSLWEAAVGETDWQEVDYSPITPTAPILDLIFQVQRCPKKNMLNKEIIPKTILVQNWRNLCHVYNK